MWAIVIKFILKLNVEELLKSNLFSNLINVFLLASEEIQSVMLQEILSLISTISKNLINFGNEKFINIIAELIIKNFDYK